MEEKIIILNQIISDLTDAMRDIEEGYKDGALLTLELTIEKLERVERDEEEEMKKAEALSLLEKE